MSEDYRARLLEEATQPAQEPLTLTEAKLYLRVDGSDEDDLIGQMIVAVRRAAEHYLRRTLVSRQWRLLYDEYAPLAPRLPMGPVTSIVSVTLLAEDGSPEIMDTALYHLNAARTRLCFDQAPSAFQVEILYLAGYGTATDVPGSIRQGMLAHLAEMYDGRALAAGLPDAALALYVPHREVSL